MTARRKVALVTALGAATLLLTGLSAGTANAHGSMESPVSRVSGCFAEGPESPDSAACQALVAAGGTQPLYDWNEVNIANAAGKHREIIPDGKLCSANRDKYQGLDVGRADWPATNVSAGNFTFKYRATAPHKGSIELYITKDGFDPSQPLKWSDLESKPFASVTDPQLSGGSYVFDGNIPNRSGRHLIYSIWQRSDSPEAFYTCSDVSFGGAQAGNGGDDSEIGEPTSRPGSGGQEPAPAPEAPSEEQIEAGSEKSTVDHNGHGGDTPAEQEKGAEYLVSQQQEGNAPEPAAAQRNLARTGGDSSTLPLAAGGATVLALGAVTLIAARRRSANRRAQ